MNECRDIGDSCFGVSIEVLSERWGKASHTSEIDVHANPSPRWLTLGNYVTSHGDEKRALEATWEGLLCDKIVWFVRKDGEWLAVVGLRVGHNVML